MDPPPETYSVYHYDEVPENKSWASTLPVKQGLYDPSLEKDNCGVGFACHIKGKSSHQIISEAKYLLCNMTHRGAVGADARDGDGAGVMTSMPDKFMQREFKYRYNIELPPAGQYAVGNLFFKKDDAIFIKSKATFESIAESQDLKVLGWREVPVDSSLLGPASLSREPKILQPAVVMQNVSDPFDAAEFEKRLYILRKQATHTIGLHNWFYICSLSSKNIVYKGQLVPPQVYSYYHDLVNVDYECHFALVHSRFSTNTFPSWDRAQPLRWVAHNGEINTLRGNKNWMRAREGVMKSKLFGDELDKLYPIIEEGGSDSAALDNVLELLVINGVLSLPEAIMLLVPEAWQHNDHLDPRKKAFYEWAACLMEPWDGPALFVFADGRFCGANLDRNGLRPCRYYITSDDVMVCASEVGVVPVESSKVVQKGRLQPGRMLLVDTEEGRIVDDRELKKQVASRFDFKAWILSNMMTMPELCEKLHNKGVSIEIPVDYSLKPDSDPRMKAFGYTLEQVLILLGPMAIKGKENLGSMGNDAALACLSEQPQLIYEYFRELFAQVTNPPIDPIRERIVMSLECYVGPQGNLLEMTPSQCNRLKLKSPILTNSQLQAIKEISKVYPKWSVREVDITFPVSEGLTGYTDAIDRVCQEATQAIIDNNQVIILSDRAISADKVPLSALVAAGAVHHHLVRQKQRSRVAIIVETAEAREVHHFCCLVGYGADAVNPYLAMDTICKLNKDGLLAGKMSQETVLANYKHAIDDGIMKVMSKMGISTLASYKGAQIFEILGIDNSVVDRCFAGTASRIKGVTFEYIAQDAFTMHTRGYSERDTVKPAGLPESGEYSWRDGGDAHVNEPAAIANLQDAVRNKNQKAYSAYAKKEHEAIRNCTLRGLLDFDYKDSTPVPIDQVEPWTEIVRRFVTGAMSYGSISMEAHSTLAVAMNRLGGKSNTGEGGEDVERSRPNAAGDSMRSAIKQIASGRFGVTSYYLSDAEELQIKMAQGAKPGEGGELPGYKVSKSIAKTRHSTPGVGLISPPPHHDIYSIEDLKQLIYDLKCANPRARVSVKLVSEVGVGIIASGVAKAKADHILISGHDGGTGAARWTGIKHAGLPWELGLAETHQTLVLNDLRGRVVIQADGQMKTGRDIAVACLLGAEEWGFATAPLIALGCVYNRKCHANTCPVGIATQDPKLRAHFKGTPEHVINFFYYLANEMRTTMAKLGFRTVDEMVGRADKLVVRDDLRTTKNANIDLSPILTPAHQIRPGVATRCVKKQDHRLHVRLDNKLIDEAEITLDKGLPVTVEAQAMNTDRAIGTTLSYRCSKKFGPKSLPHDTIHVNITGSAGQSFGAFLAAGITLELEGDSNDYVGKGLSGGRLIIYPPKDSPFKAEENIIIGNTCLYGATSGTAFIRGIAAERFAVRNSGATAVVEGTGDHGCEYMTGGRVVVLGSVGRNFAAGMSGGIAYVLDMAQDFEEKVNRELVGLESLTDPAEIAFLRALLEDHRHYTGSEIADRILNDFNRFLKKFVKVIPYEYQHVLDAEAKKQAELGEKEASSLFNTVKDDPEADVTGGEFSKPTVLERVKKSEPKVADLEDVAGSSTKASEKLVKLGGFMRYKRRNEKHRPPKSRINDWKEMTTRLSEKELQFQTARCIDCGIPFCQSDTGCPVSNIIPKWNEMVFKGLWKDALKRLLMTNNFPEFTGRVCPAPCEGACVVNVSGNPAVGIKSIEAGIIDHAFKEGWIVPDPPKFRTGKHIAVVGSGPAGLACADQLNKAGHLVTVYERANRPGGLLMYGIPNMKLDKGVVKRRTDLMEAEGVEFVCSCSVGEDITVEELEVENDAVVFAVGSTIPRDLKIPGRDLKNIHFALELLKPNTEALLDGDLEEIRKRVAGKDVVVIGGGDTGNDCLGTSTRHGANSVTNFELLPKPPKERARDNPWPQWPRIFRVDYGHTEVKEHYGKDPREYCVLSKEFVGDEDGNVKGINTVRVEWKRSDSGAWQMAEIPGSEQFFPAQLVLLSMGFVGPEADKFKVATTKRGTIVTAQSGSYKVDASSKLFAAGDCRRGQSLVVWGIQEGRQCAREIDVMLMSKTALPGNGSIEKRDYKMLEELAAKV
ncbi:glutamate synthase [NADH] [Brettanomyces nanus]|uniref:Glutamate synthase [NADH] n=1 Tax=Eeniella nana TaxID=13502 RepID=A0A875RZ82_EENNA|nr:glutamate synthase [NADH] [Brettanomyces nanus]QPG74841.1 glutamate synthase [NADH] [Brettanomyces nanus]